MLQVLFLLETLTSKMSKFMTYLALIFLCWACKPFLMDGVTTILNIYCSCVKVAVCLNLVGCGCLSSSVAVDLEMGDFCMAYCDPVWVLCETFSFSICVEVALSSDGVVS